MGFNSGFKGLIVWWRSHLHRKRHAATDRPCISAADAPFPINYEVESPGGLFSIENSPPRHWKCWIKILTYFCKVKGKVYPRTGHEDPERERESRGIALLFP